MVRAFFAVELTDDVRNQCSAVQDILKESDATINCVESALAHITIRFLGEVSDDVMHRIQEKMSAFSFKPAVITVSGVELHPQKRPRIVWANVSDNGWGETIVAELDSLLSSLGIAPEDRTFTPHVTLCRIKHYDSSLRVAVEAVSGRTFGQMTIDTIMLKKSTLTPRGQIYEDIMEIKA
jgi:2'-5' RNA ligase